MSVREGLLAILTLGPAYGLQLHSEFMARAQHRKAVNVGQIYGTLERLSKQELVAGAGTTQDGLPRYELTAEGRRAAHEWMSTPSVGTLPDWTEMLDQILITATVDEGVAMAIAKHYRRWWEQDLEATRDALQEEPATADGRLALLSREVLAVAALAWLGAATAELAEPRTARALSTTRPKRGRRPHHAISV